MGVPKRLWLIPVVCSAVSILGLLWAFVSSDTSVKDLVKKPLGVATSLAFLSYLFVRSIDHMMRD